MNNKIIKYLIVILLSTFLFVGLTVNADTGPKPSVHITINDFQGDEMYVTLLGKRESYGPYQKIDEGSEEYNDLSTIEKKFNDYSKTTGYYFYNVLKKVNKIDNVFSWTYYPPSEFLILCYIESSDIFVVTSEPLTSYAFSSYYSIDIINDNGTYVIGNIKKNYNYTSEIIHFFLRVLLTLVVEISLAFFIFIFRGKAFIVITITNIITQIGLNLFLNVYCFNNGYGYVLNIYYVMAELLITLCEMIIYIILLKRINKEYKTYKIIIYAIVANVLSFVIGLLLMLFVPGFA